MELLLYIAAVNAIVLYCIFNKWTELEKKVCMFCIFFWVCLVETIVVYLYGSLSAPDIWKVFIEFSKACLLAVFTNVMYFYIKHLNE